MVQQKASAWVLFLHADVPCCYARFCQHCGSHAAHQYTIEALPAGVLAVYADAWQQLILLVVIWSSLASTSRSRSAGLKPLQLSSSFGPPSLKQDMGLQSELSCRVSYQLLRRKGSRAKLNCCRLNSLCSNSRCVPHAPCNWQFGNECLWVMIDLQLCN